MEATEINEDNYREIREILEPYPEFKVAQNYTLAEFIKISGKYGNDEDFLHATLQVFQQYKEQFNDSYEQFLSVTPFNEDNYREVLRAIEPYPEFKVGQNYTLSEFLGISEMYEHDEGFLK